MNCCQHCKRQQHQFNKNNFEEIEEFKSVAKWLQIDDCRKCRIAQVQYSILFRDALYELLTIPLSSSTSTSNANNVAASKTGPQRPNKTEMKVSAASDFPSLQETMRTVKPKVHRNEKRRIRPLMSTTAVNANGNVNFNVSVGNISSLPSVDPINACSSTSTHEHLSPTNTNRSVWGASNHDFGGGVKKPKSKAKAASFTTVPKQSKPFSSLPNSPISFNMKGNDDGASMISNVGEDSETSKTCSSSCANPRLSFEDTRDQVEGLARIYSTLLHQQLVPSLAIELALIVRFVESTFEQENIGLTSKIIFAAFFVSSQSYCYFVDHILNGVDHMLLCLDHKLVKAFQNHPVLRMHCPKITHTINIFMKTDRQRSLEKEISHEEIIGKRSTSIFSLPFQSDRDSRHNYRTAEQTQMYRNREESRDTFLRSLRLFQDLRGNFGVSKAGHMESLQSTSRGMLAKLFPSNLWWFAEFFCDLLLQLGLVPMEETDKEVLKKISDIDRLQKLHKRFSSKEGKMKKKNVNLRRQHKSSVACPFTQPDQFFSGYQEFFYLFIRSCDSYKLNIHLTRHLSSKISRFMELKDGTPFVQRMSMLKVCAKFLGFLVFSPYWKISIPAKSSDIQMVHSAQSPFPLKDYITVAYRDHSMIGVLPWVFEYLRMMKWSDISKRTSYYKDVFIFLRMIYREIGCIANSHNDYKSNILLASMILERIFEETIGWRTADQLPPDVSLERLSIGNTNEEDKCNLDFTRFGFSKAFLYELVPQLEDLEKTLTERGDAKGNVVLGISRKVRPNTISTNDKIEVSNNVMLYSPARPKRAHKATIVLTTRIQDRLASAFFHQHQDLQKIADFIAETTIRNFSREIEPHIVTAVDEKLHSLGEASRLFIKPSSASFDLSKWSELIGSIQENACSAATTAMQKRCKKDIEASMAILMPMQESDKVVNDVAIKLTIQHAIRKGITQIESFVKVESKRYLDEALEKQNSKI